jgi:HAD superfamily hydrolase (TIGR01509 family)
LPESFPFSNSSSFAVLWDLDGVLCDSAELHYQSWVIAFGEHGYSCEHDFFLRTFGMNNTGVIQARLGNPPAELIEQISERKEILFRQTIPGGLKALPGVRDRLERLSARGTSMAVASSAPLLNITDALDELGLRSYFQAIVSVAGRPGKPDPLVFLEAAEKLGFPAERCIVIEDAIAGVEAAKRSGMKCIAVLTTNPAEALQAADVIVEGLDQLTEDVFQRLME